MSPLGGILSNQQTRTQSKLLVAFPFILHLRQLKSLTIHFNRPIIIFILHRNKFYYIFLYQVLLIRSPKNQQSSFQLVYFQYTSYL